MDGKLITRHCISSTSETYDGDQWVTSEVLALGPSRIVHWINGREVLSYELPQIGGGSVDPFHPWVKHDGKILHGGSISLQSESHPLEFRKVELLDLEGCMDEKAKNYKSYFVKADNSRCRY